MAKVVYVIWPSVTSDPAGHEDALAQHLQDKLVELVKADATFTADPIKPDPKSKDKGEGKAKAKKPKGLSIDASLNASLGGTVTCKMTFTGSKDDQMFAFINKEHSEPGEKSEKGNLGLANMIVDAVAVSAMKQILVQFRTR